MPQKYLTRISTGLPFGGNRVPGRMMPSKPTYTLDAEGRIEANPDPHRKPPGNRLRAGSSTRR